MATVKGEGALNLILHHCTSLVVAQEKGEIQWVTIYRYNMADCFYVSTHSQNDEVKSFGNSSVYCYERPIPRCHRIDYNAKPNLANWFLTVNFL